MSIVVTNVTKYYGDIRALDNVSLKIGPGEIVGFLGPNGAGKSTLMKIITCYLSPTSGEVFVNGFSVQDDSLSVRNAIGYLPENNPVYMEMYVTEFLKFSAKIHGTQTDIRERIEEIVRITGLSSEKGKKISALSKGYRQRVGIARALIHDPSVLILDEPTSGLDPNQIVEIRQLIKESGKQKTVMLSTHIMQEVEAICDRVIIINKGRIVADDKTENLRQLVQAGKKVVSVEFNENIPEDVLKTIEGVTRVTRVGNCTYSIETNGQDIRQLVFKFAVSKGLTVLTMHIEDDSLERIFQSLTGN